MNILRYLGQNGANFNVTDRDGKHPLHYAASNLNNDALLYLLDGNRLDSGFDIYQFIHAI